MFCLDVLSSLSLFLGFRFEDIKDTAFAATAVQESMTDAKDVGLEVWRNGHILLQDIFYVNVHVRQSFSQWLSNRHFLSKSVLHCKR